MTDTKDEARVREELERALQTTGLRDRALAPISIGELCKRYGNLKPRIDAALKFLKHIPKWGRIIVQVIETLETIADEVCKLGGPVKP